MENLDTCSTHDASQNMQDGPAAFAAGGVVVHSFVAIVGFVVGIEQNPPRHACVQGSSGDTGACGIVDEAIGWEW